MLPPGLLERLELVAERTPVAVPAGDRIDRRRRPRPPRPGRPRRDPVRDLAGPDGRAGLLRRLRRLADQGFVTLDWTLLGAGGGPRYERWVRPTDAAARRRAMLAAGDRPPAGHSGRARSPRSPSWPTRPPTGCPPRSSVPGTDRRRSPGSCAAAWPSGEVRERPRRPLAGRPPGLRGGRPPGSDLSPPQADAVARIERGHRGPRPDAAPARWRHRERQDRDLRRGDRGQPARGGGPPSCSSRDRPGPAPGRPAPGGPRRPGRARPLGPG